jgi:tripartite-type tricarboxylate transporter receptor subunit TctC
MKGKKLAQVLGIMLSLSLVITGCAGRKKENNVASKFPTKPIQVIVPMAAGGPSDLTARAMEKLSKQYLGESLVVVNKTGAGGALGYNELVESKADGHTIGLAATNMLLQPIYGGTAHNYPQDTVAIAQAVYNPIAVAVLADSPIKTLDDLVKYAQSNPGKIKYAYTNVGSLPHVVSGMFVNQTKVKMEPVPFQGGADSLTAFLGKNVQLMFTQVSEFKNYAKDGKVRILAVATEKRLPNFPDVPTFKENMMDIVASTWFGIAAPKSIPDDVKAKLSEGFKNIINDASFKKTAEDLGFYVEYLGPNEMAAKWQQETKVYTEAIKVSGIGEEMAKQAGKK